MQAKLCMAGFLVAVAWSSLAGAARRAPGAVEFSMRKISTFEEALRNRSMGYRLVRGQYVKCSNDPTEEVTAYPELSSNRPMYGAIKFAKEYGKRDSGIEYAFVVDESGGTGKGYDRLYFDLNRDADLTNDPALSVLATPPAGADPYQGRYTSVFFDYLTVPFHFDDASDVEPSRLLPKLIVFDKGRANLYFIATEARKGRVKIAGRSYGAVLAQRSISGRFDRPYTALYLTRQGSGGGAQRARWWGADSLKAMHRIGGKLYRFSASPTGERLTVAPYDGDFGVFKVDAGDRHLKKLGMRGSLNSKEAAVAVGDLGKDESWPGMARECKIPVGDYYPAYLSIELGRLSIKVSNNYHADGSPRDRQGRPAVHGIRIRKDRPFVLDFSKQPAVMFASPAKGQRFKRGDNVSVKGVLIDPMLDIMIRGLRDTSRKETKTAKLSTGKTRKYTRSVSLDPFVTVTSAAGVQVAKGVMPFG